MKNLASFNGKRLQTARMYRGMTTSELASKLEVTRQTISDYETGRAKNPEVSKIQKMSLVLEFPMNFFLEADSDSISVAPSTYFRSQLTTNKKYRIEQSKRIEFVCRIYAFVNEYIEFPPLNLPEYNGDDPEEAAALLRRHWNLGERPIENLIYLAEQNGLILTSFDTSTSTIDAFSQQLMIDDETRYVIALSKNKNTAARVHFDVAHELGHIMLHDWNEDVECLSPEEFRIREQEANLFAASFLLPQDAYIRDVGMYGNNLTYYIQLKKKWRVSIAAMIMRSKNLDLIDYNQYQFLMRKMQKQGIRKQEPLDDTLVTASPSMLKTAVEMLLNGNVLTPSDFVQELSYEHNMSLYSGDIEELLGLRSGTLTGSNVIPIHGLSLKGGNNLEDD